MINYFEGTVFNSNAQALVNTINIVGVMGAGIALEFGLRYPDMLKDYEQKCINQELYMGKVDYFKLDNEYIINFPTKLHFKYPSKLKWIEEGLKNFVETYKNYNIKSVAFPKLGTARGGLSWADVKPLMEKYLSSLDIEVTICLDNLEYAQGKEKEMLDAFNRTDIEQLSKEIRLTKKQIAKLNEYKPYNRFWKIAATDGIGAKTYSNIFNYYYNKNDDEVEQISLF